MITISQLIEYARQQNCSDIHITAELPVMFRQTGRLRPSQFQLTPAEQQNLLLSMLSEKQKSRLQQGQDIDFAYQTPDGSRQRVNIYRQQGHLCAALRILNNTIPTLKELGHPPILKQLANEARGLVLVTGPTGSGKSTTLAAMINEINQSRSAHVITIEDPIEYVYKHGQCMIHQREVGTDVESFHAALRSAMREDPDVILVGEMRDYETISAAVTAAETGHLVFSTLHTTGAAQTIDRIIDVFPPNAQGQIRAQLSGVLRSVITQTLLPRLDQAGRVAAMEILIGSDAVLNLIREGKAHQIKSTIQSSGNQGMQTLNQSLANLAKRQVIGFDTAQQWSDDPKELHQYLQF